MFWLGHADGRLRIESRWRLLGRAALPGWLILLALLLLWPITRGGYLLGHDMVFTPRQPLNLPAVGVSSSPPRAVPLDALVALAERIVNGAIVGRIVLVALVLAAGLGTAAVMRVAPPAARIAAGTVAVWNPFVVERLALGQWALLWCYAAVPWIVLAITRGRGASGWLGRGVALGAASITPTGGLIAAVVAVAVAWGARRPRRDVMSTTALALVLQLPWIVPAVVSTASSTSDPAAVTAFAARSEHAGGVLFSLLAGGGVWDREVVPDSHGGVLPWIWLAVLVAAAMYGTPALTRVLGFRVVAALGSVAGVGLLLALLPSVPGGAGLMRSLVDHVPGAGLLRDAQKWLVPLVVMEAFLVGAAVSRLARVLASGVWRPALLVAAASVPLIVLPDAAATLRPTLEPTHYPSDWSAVSARIHGGDVAVLPPGSYRDFSWVASRNVIDPAPRLLPAPAVVDDRIAVNGTLLAGEDPRAAAVRHAFSRDPGLAARLASLGIAWVVVEHGTAGQVPPLNALDQVYAGSDVSLYRVPGDVKAIHIAPVRVVAVLVADALAVLVLFALFIWASFRRIRRE